jgi:hypothetical protein
MRLDFFIIQKKGLAMNSYSVNALLSQHNKTQSVSILYVFFPLFFGIIVDILFTQVMGSQFCSLNKTEYKCIIHGIHVTQWQREIVRFVAQLGLIMSAILFVQYFSPSLVYPLYTSLFGIIGLILCFIVQTDLFIDFRRFFNGIVFSLKHN